MAATDTQQGKRQQSVRDATGTATAYEGDWHALFDLDGIVAGPYNGRLLAWINLTLGATYTSLPDAQAAYAATQGADNWSAMGSLGTNVSNDRITADGEIRITADGDIRVIA